MNKFNFTLAEKFTNTLHFKNTLTFVDNENDACVIIPEINSDVWFSTDVDDNNIIESSERIVKILNNFKVILHDLMGVYITNDDIILYFTGCNIKFRLQDKLETVYAILKSLCYDVISHLPYYIDYNLDDSKEHIGYIGYKYDTDEFITNIKHNTEDTKIISVGKAFNKNLRKLFKHLLYYVLFVVKNNDYYDVVVETPAFSVQFRTPDINDNMYTNIFKILTYINRMSGLYKVCGFGEYFFIEFDNEHIIFEHETNTDLCIGITKQIDDTLDFIDKYINLIVRGEKLLLDTIKDKLDRYTHIYDFWNLIEKFNENLIDEIIAFDKSIPIDQIINNAINTTVVELL